MFSLENLTSVQVLTQPNLSIMRFSHIKVAISTLTGAVKALDPCLLPYEAPWRLSVKYGGQVLLLESRDLHVL